ncbi:unnamed protein product [Plutella xylostella]|uniref:(diamondback moth) hypothetical protein n=1 Tax=Plutella xylostella TaxID=51655 RepID=A0A8S4FUC0_PLUXY|nr:unnamed protein product [Plutella xylostella]
MLVVIIIFDLFYSEVTMSEQKILLKDSTLLKVRRIIVDPQKVIISRPKKPPVGQSRALIHKSLKVLPILKEDIIYESGNQNDDYIKGKYSKVILKNQLHRFNNRCRTSASYITLDGQTEVKTSNRLVNLIGQQNYDAVFVALCSIISQDLKIRAMLALLTTDKPAKDAACQTLPCMKCYTDSKVYADVASQTMVRTEDIFDKKKPTIKRKVTSFVIKSEKPPTGPKVNRIYINPHSKEDCQMLEEQDKKCSNVDPEDHKSDVNITENTDIDSTIKCRPSLPELKPFLLEEDSNTSNISLSNFSVCSEILHAQETNLQSKIDCNIKQDKTPEAKSPPPDSTKDTLKKSDVDWFLKNFHPTPIQLFDGTYITLPDKPEDQFHLITSNILKNLPEQDRKKLIQHQAYIDHKLCLETNEDGYMPIHLAVLNDDVGLIRRQGVVLKHRGQTVDVTTREGLTPLDLAILGRKPLACVTSLLLLGASPVTSLHRAAEAPAEYLRAALQAMDMGAR